MIHFLEVGAVDFTKTTTRLDACPNVGMVTDSEKGCIRGSKSPYKFVFLYLWMPRNPEVDQSCRQQLSIGPVTNFLSVTLPSRKSCSMN